MKTTVGVHRKAEFIFWSVALGLLIVFALYTIFALHFLLARVTTAIGQTATAPPLLQHFDFATLNQVLEGKSGVPVQAP